MPTVRQVEKQIEDVEGLWVTVTHKNGRRVRSDAILEEGYPYVKKAAGSISVSHWKRLRFNSWAPEDFLVEVVDRPGRGSQAWDGRYLLDTVRNGGERRRIKKSRRR